MIGKAVLDVEPGVIGRIVVVEHAERVTGFPVHMCGLISIESGFHGIGGDRGFDNKLPSGDRLFLYPVRATDDGHHDYQGG